MYRALAFIGACLLATNAQAQAPGTEIFLIDLQRPEQPPKNISQHAGYDNQPAFSADGSTIYYSRMEDDAQTDIWCFHLQSGRRYRLTDTAESEYSPTPVIEQHAITVVRVEADGRQRLWQIDLSDHSSRLLIEDMEPVGYHTWFSPGAVALFMLPEPFTLTLYASSQERLNVAQNIGRALQRHPKTGELLYLDKNRVPWMIRAFSSAGEQYRDLAPAFPQEEDFAVSSDGDLWTGVDSRVYRRGDGDSRWSLVAADLAQHGIRSITRLAVSPDRRYLAVVSGE